jgi:hypothetical protein
VEALPAPDSFPAAGVNAALPAGRTRALNLSNERVLASLPGREVMAPTMPLAGLAPMGCVLYGTLPWMTTAPPADAALICWTRMSSSIYIQQQANAHT